MAVTARSVPILKDNYAWLLRDTETGATAIVDPAEGAPIIAAIEADGGRLDLILLTHHHGDHIADADIVRARYPGVKMVGAAADAHRLPKLDQAVREGDTVQLGNATEMFSSLSKLAALPDDTLVCCGHEYTESNAKFALSVDPDNAALRARAEEAHRQRAAGKPTIPSRLGDEKRANPFLLAKDAATLADVRGKKDRF